MFLVVWFGISGLLATVIAVFVANMHKLTDPDEKAKWRLGILMGLIALPILLFGTCVGILNFTSLGK